MSDRQIVLKPLLNGETLLSFSKLCRKVAGSRDNANAAPSTLFRWVTTGCRSASGRLVRLEAVRVGAKWMSSEEALARFFQELTDLGQTVAEPMPTPAARNRAATAASRELDRLIG